MNKTHQLVVVIPLLCSNKEPRKSKYRTYGWMELLKSDQLQRDLGPIEKQPTIRAGTTRSRRIDCKMNIFQPIQLSFIRLLLRMVPKKLDYFFPDYYIS